MDWLKQFADNAISKNLHFETDSSGDESCQINITKTDEAGKQTSMTENFDNLEDALELFKSEDLTEVEEKSEDKEVVEAIDEKDNTENTDDEEDKDPELSKFEDKIDETTQLNNFNLEDSIKELTGLAAFLRGKGKTTEAQKVYNLIQEL